MKYKANGLITINNKIKYMFLSWEKFYNKFTQIYRDLEAIIIAKYKLQELI